MALLEHVKTIVAGATRDVVHHDWYNHEHEIKLQPSARTTEKNFLIVTAQNISAAFKTAWERTNCKRNIIEEAPDYAWTLLVWAKKKDEPESGHAIHRLTHGRIERMESRVAEHNRTAPPGQRFGDVESRLQTLNLARNPSGDVMPIARVENTTHARARAIDAMVQQRSLQAQHQGNVRTPMSAYGAAVSGSMAAEQGVQPYSQEDEWIEIRARKRGRCCTNWVPVHLALHRNDIAHLLGMFIPVVDVRMEDVPDPSGPNIPDGQHTTRFTSRF